MRSDHESVHISSLMNRIIVLEINYKVTNGKRGENKREEERSPH